MDEALGKYVLIPFIAILGIYIAGTTIESLFKIPSAAVYLFSAVGGIYFIAKFYK